MTMKVTIKNEHTDPSVALMVERAGEKLAQLGPDSSSQFYTWVGAPLILTEVHVEKKAE
jgi:hypothetical protein